MRQLGSVLLGMLAAPVMFVLIGRGLGGLRDVAGQAPAAEQTDYFAIVTAACATGLAGLLLAALLTARVSPLGPALCGAAYLGVGVLALLRPTELPRWVPDSILEEGHLAIAALVGLLLAVPMLLTVCFPHRWRGRPAAAAGLGYPPPVPAPAAPPPAAIPLTAPMPAPAAPPPAAVPFAPPVRQPAEDEPTVARPGDESTITLPLNRPEYRPGR